MKKITAKFRAYLKRIGFSESNPMARLAGIHELREVVAWANATAEYEHDFMTPEELIERYRKAQAE